jgi:hypothetical protein
MSEKEIKKNSYRITKNDIITFFVLLTISTVVFLLVFLLNASPSLISACDGAFAAGVTIISALGLQILARMGAFDTFGYSFSTLVTSFSPRVEKKYADLFEYRNIKSTNRSKNKLFFLSYLLVGGGYIITALILNILFRLSIGL